MDACQEPDLRHFPEKPEPIFPVKHQEKFLYSKGLSRLTTTRHHGKIIEHENGELATRMKSDWKGALMQYGIV